MRVVKEIAHPQYKITIFSWNGKYLLKIEAGPYEQTYKISEMDIAGDADVERLVDAVFLAHITEVFQKMHGGLHAAIEKL